MGSGTDGILLIDKGIGETSHDVVKKVRSTFRGENRVRVGHAGTLDPFATGLLIALVGQGTKLSQFIMPGEKVYVAILRLGIETDTMDPTGEVVATQPVPVLGPEYIREKARQFVGKSRQVPPIYSAVRHKGKRAYELARKGQRVDLRAREITVHSFKILSVDLPLVTMRIRCSSGTYIRRLASDFGRALGPGGHLRTLRRIRSGPFEVGDALPSALIGAKTGDDSLSERVIPLREAMPHLREIIVEPAFAEKVRQGCQPVWEDLVVNSGRQTDLSSSFRRGWSKLVSDGRLVAVVNVLPRDTSGNARLKIERVFLP